MRSAKKSLTESATSPEFVAPILPATAQRPEAARRVNFIKALLLFWLLPGRWGPHLAVGSFGRAFAAHLIAVVVATGIIGVQPLFEWAGERFAEETVTPHTVRVALADAVLVAAAESAGSPGAWIPIVTVIVAFPALQIVLLVLGTLAMPWAAGGDRASSVWKRSVKNVYWSSTILIPFAVGYMLFQQIDWGPLHRHDLALNVAVFGIFVLTVVVALRLPVVGAHRYVGDPDGPAFAPREPICDACGYAIVHLPLETRCPECGLPVPDSLPGGRRQPTVWQRHELRPSGFLDLIRLQWVVLRNPAFFQRLPVQSGVASARHFWWGTLLLIAFGLLLVLSVLTKLFPVADDSAFATFLPLGVSGTFIAMFGLPLLFGLQAAMMFVACLVAQFRYGIRDYRCSAIVCYYASPMMWPLVVIVLAGVMVLSAPVGPILHSVHPIAIWGEHVGLPLLVAVFILFGAAIVSVVFWFSRLTAALSATRYANV